MSTFATLSGKERFDYVQEAAVRLGATPIIVEKDFWVCWILGRLFDEPAIREHIVFKGGTSLSKVFRIIDRFSEDVDLSVSQEFLGRDESFLEEAQSSSQRRRRMQEVGALCSRVVDEKLRPVLERSVGRILGKRHGDVWLTHGVDPGTDSPTLTFEYPSAVESESGYVPQAVKMEFGSLTDQRPVGEHPISAMVGEVFPDEFDDAGARVVALEVERTFWEKGTILHAEHHRPKHLGTRDRFARHYYDFAALWKHSSRPKAMGRLDLLERVRSHKGRFFASSWASYATAVPGTFRLIPPEYRLAGLAADYVKMAPMILGDPPVFRVLMEQLAEAEGTINGG